MNFPEKVDDGDLDLFLKECRLAGYYVDAENVLRANRDGWYSINISEGPGPKWGHYVLYQFNGQGEWAITYRGYWHQGHSGGP